MFGLLKRVVAPLAALALGLMASTAASAATVPIVSFQPLAVAGQPPVIVLDAGGNLTTGGGAASLLVNVTNPALVAASGTGITFPASLTLTGFVETGAAFMMGTDIVQALSTGRFTISDGSGLLLTGSVNNAQIVTNSLTGSVLSGNFGYDGGSLFAAFPAAGLYNPGEFSLTLTAITPVPLTIGANGQLSPFQASATGNFSAQTVPLPATAWMGLFLIGGVGGARGITMLRRRNALLAA